jgi:hypothetical protein
MAQIPVTEKRLFSAWPAFLVIGEPVILSRDIKKLSAKRAVCNTLGVATNPTRFRPVVLSVWWRVLAALDYSRDRHHTPSARVSWRILVYIRRRLNDSVWPDDENQSGECPKGGIPAAFPIARAA